MSGLLRRIADAVYREYDRRIKRASEITEYGVAHRHDHGEAHADDEVAIVNLLPGEAADDERAHRDVTTRYGEAAIEHLEIEPLTTDSETARKPPAGAEEEEIEAEIINAPPGASIPRE
ncbi:MAG: hypothetical protein NZ699_13485 [Roseiflexus sp.]|nr:hypothetical protein [Roseiflexus sp.]MCS7290136.1 hypothetical protein [Roseiflexus sp.]MDW8147688.1 hypothetical protein [Roseiflexaceae bacterium]MDW8234296.1 hypothetical protein [Roseiflexaceae bacterium]